MANNSRSLMKLARNICIAILSGVAVYYALLLVGCLLFSLSYSQLTAEIGIALQTLSNAAIIRFFFAVQTISLFVLPAFVFLKLQRISVVERHSSVFSPIFLLGAIVLFIIINTPGINLLSQCNTQFVMHIVGNNSQMAQLFNHSEQVSEFLMNESTMSGLLLNIFIIALLPAVGEELFFRGFLQQILQRKSNNIHAVIFATALIFSLFHNDLFNLVPRIIMGILFGYLFFLTRYIYYAITAHFVHNAAVVAVYFLMHNNYLPPFTSHIGEIGNGVLAGILSLIIVSITMFLWWKKERNARNTKPQLIAQ